MLGDTAIALFAAPALAKRLKPRFPSALEGAPVLMPGRDNVLHDALRGWLESRRIGVRIVGEFDDGGLMKTFGAAGAGAFPAPLAMRGEIERLHGAEFVGHLDGLSERYYAISTERRATDPQVLKILALAGDILPGAERKSASVAKVPARAKKHRGHD